MDFVRRNGKRIKQCDELCNNVLARRTRLDQITNTVIKQELGTLNLNNVLDMYLNSSAPTERGGGGLKFGNPNFRTTRKQNRSKRPNS
jgi:hypothetical protein